jgi:hypothetical protein
MSERDKAAEEYANNSDSLTAKTMKYAFLAGADWAEKNSHNTRCGQLAIECDHWLIKNNNWMCWFFVGDL